MAEPNATATEVSSEVEELRKRLGTAEATISKLTRARRVLEDELSELRELHRAAERALERASPALHSRNNYRAEIANLQRCRQRDKARIERLQGRISSALRGLDLFFGGRGHGSEYLIYAANHLDPRRKKKRERAANA